MDSTSLFNSTKTANNSKEKPADSQQTNTSTTNQNSQDAPINTGLGLFNKGGLFDNNKSLFENNTSGATAKPGLFDNPITVKPVTSSLTSLFNANQNNTDDNEQTGGNGSVFNLPASSNILTKKELSLDTDNKQSQKQKADEKDKGSAQMGLFNNNQKKELDSDTTSKPAVRISFCK